MEQVRSVVVAARNFGLLVSFSPPSKGMCFFKVTGISVGLARVFRCNKLCELPQDLAPRRALATYLLAVPWRNLLIVHNFLSSLRKQSKKINIFCFARQVGICLLHSVFSLIYISTEMVHNLEFLFFRKVLPAEPVSLVTCE